MGFVRIVNMIPANMSGESNPDCEPDLAVNPLHPNDMVATTTLTKGLGGSFAPLFVSTDGGETWDFRYVVPGGPGTGDITVGFAPSGVLYAGILNGQTVVSKVLNMQILRTAQFTGTSPMTVLVNRNPEDQPWVVAGSVIANARWVDRVFVGSNDRQPRPSLATAAAVDVSQDAATAAAPAGFIETALGLRRGPYSLPPTRLAIHQDGTVYAAFLHVTAVSPTDSKNVNFELVVRRDDNWGGGANAFSDLVQPGQITPGIRVDIGFSRFGDIVGQERLGADVAIAVDPNDSSIVYVAWCNRTGGASGTDWQLNVDRSLDRGQNWSTVHVIKPIAKNPALAISAEGRVGLSYQQLTGGKWITRLELTRNAWTTAQELLVLHQSASDTPSAGGTLPYLGDYMRLLAIGNDFYGVFSGNNTPDIANFPNSVRYQRNSNWSNRVLLNVDGVTPVPASIDPFFFHWSTVKPPVSETKSITKAEIDVTTKTVASEGKGLKEIKEDKETKESGDTKQIVPKAEADLPPSKHIFKKSEFDKPGSNAPQQDPVGIATPEAEPLASLLLKLSQRVGALEQQAEQGRAFISAAERPPVGPQDDHGNDDE